MVELKLPSGATLKITPSPFAESKALYQAFLKEARGVKFNSKTEMVEVYKELFCLGFSTPEIEKCLWKCFERCTYNAGNGDLKIDASTFEPVGAREDYTQVCTEVAKENILPFVKSLYAEYQRISAMIESDPQ